MEAKKLLDRVRDAIRLKHYAIRTEEAYVHWNRRFILFHPPAAIRPVARRRER
jgi:hypothetical protein